MNLLRTLAHYSVVCVKVLWHRLPRIAAYALAIWVIFILLETLYYRAAPAAWFIQYGDIKLNNMRQGDSLLYNVCRTADHPYEIDGSRNIYIVQDQDTRARLLVKTLPISSNTLNVSERCPAYRISSTDYYFEPGSYELRVKVNLRLKYGERRNYEVKSNVFTVYAREVQTLQDQVDDLERRLQDLQERVDRQNVPMTSPSVQGSNGGATDVLGSSSDGQVQSDAAAPTESPAPPTPTSPAPPQQPAVPTAPPEPETRRPTLLESVLGIIGL